MKKIAKECETRKANAVYKGEIGQANTTSNHAPTVLPRNLKQLQNMHLKYLQQLRLSRDDLYNLHEISYDIYISRPNMYLWVKFRFK